MNHDLGALPPMGLAVVDWLLPVVDRILPVVDWVLPAVDWVLPGLLGTSCC